jgi:hypothetical protein
MGEITGRLWLIAARGRWQLSPLRTVASELKMAWKLLKQLNAKAAHQERKQSEYCHGHHDAC